MNEERGLPGGIVSAHRFSVPSAVGSDSAGASVPPRFGTYFENGVGEACG
jgi:hypothetical protein